VLVELAASMRAHRRGGSMLVVPADSSAWRESIVHPIPYAVSPPFTELGELVRNGVGRHSRRELGRTVAALAGLTAIDGATVINGRHEMLAFGVKIGGRDGQPRVEQVIVTEPIEGSLPAIVHPSELGGTRHLSAAQFVQDQRDALALVASQDGRFTVFAWSPCDELVHAHRVDVLLL
jgi:DNA integrity scanning protein DisA with diadenylate cyclase activity